VTEGAVKAVVRAHDDLDRKTKEAKNEVDRSVEDAQKEKEEAERTKVDIENQKKSVKKSSDEAKA